MRTREQQGSVLLATLLLCLGIGVLVTALASQIALSRSGLMAETDGRRLAARAEGGLQVALEQAAAAWAPAFVELGHGVSIALEDADGFGGPVLRARSVASSDGGSFTITALVERGSDGPDLPRRAIAAQTIVWDPDRPTTVVCPDDERTPSEEVSGSPQIEVAVAQEVFDLPMGEGVSLEVGASWSLDPLLAIPNGATSRGPMILMVPQGATVRSLLTAQGGLALSSSPESPLILIGPGPLPLDATGCGDLYAVLLGGAGGVTMDGTVLHGAVMTEGPLDVGSSGQIRFDSGVLEWARHRSIVRVRLVPGSREERVTGPGG